MRTTLTLDEDVAAKLTEEARRTGRPFKRVVNEALRTGLAAKANAGALPPFRIAAKQTFRIKSDFNYVKAEDLFDELDGAGRLR